MTVQDDLLALEHRLWTGGADDYRDILDADCLIAFTEMAGLMTRDQIADSAGDGGRWHDVETEGVGVVQPTDEVAILTYRAQATRKDGEPYRALLSSAYVRRDGEWKMAFHQQTPLTETG